MIDLGFRIPARLGYQDNQPSTPHLGVSIGEGDGPTRPNTASRGTTFPEGERVRGREGERERGREGEREGEREQDSEREPARDRARERGMQ